MYQTWECALNRRLQVLLTKCHDVSYSITLPKLRALSKITSHVSILWSLLDLPILTTLMLVWSIAQILLLTFGEFKWVHQILQYNKFFTVLTYVLQIINRMIKIRPSPALLKYCSRNWWHFFATLLCTLQRCCNEKDHWIFRIWLRLHIINWFQLHFMVPANISGLIIPIHSYTVKHIQTAV